MNTLVLSDVTYKKDGSCWKHATIKKLNGGGRCAISKTEQINATDLYLYNYETWHPNVQTPPDGSYKVILSHYWFSSITTEIDSVLLIQCEPLKSKGYYKLKYPLTIELQNENSYI